MTNEQIFSSYYNILPEQVETIDLCRGDDDYCRVYITDNGAIELAIKHTSNNFTDIGRIAARHTRDGCTADVIFNII